MNHYCKIARSALRRWLEKGKKEVHDLGLGRKAACFVSLHQLDGDLRGCIGTLAPVHHDLAQEIATNAIAAGTRDPRFSPVQLEEMSNLRFEISILAPAEAIVGPSFLDPARYGVIVENEGQRGVLLPGLSGITCVDQQIQIARRKAGIPESAPIRISRFEVESHHET